VEPPRLASVASISAAVASRVLPALVTSKGAASVAVKPAETATSSRQALTERQNDGLNNPWLRGIVMVSSVQHAMTVTMFGEPNYRGLTQYMQKPASSVVMTFSHDPHLGMTADAFTGSAVVFQATMTFDERRHAALR
jgi:hypothetical protein